MGFLKKIFKLKTKTTAGLFHHTTLRARIRDIYKDSKIILRDRRYAALSLKDFLEFQKIARGKKRLKYEREKFDCDDFAITYWADIKRAWAKIHKGAESLACGIVDGEFISKTDEKPFRHTMIWVFTKQGTIVFIEPQADFVPFYDVKYIFRLEG